MARTAQKSHPAEPELPLAKAVAALAKLYPLSKPLRDPLAILVWENVGYLIDDERRGALFEEFRKRIGLKAAQIANAPTPILADIAKRGGMNPQVRTDRLKEIGRLAICECDGDVVAKLNALPLPKARALLKKFPSVGEPGADRIILFAGIAARPAISSDGLRALIRLGYVAQQKSYGATYRIAIQILEKDGVQSTAWYETAYLALREHGRALCKRAAPVCEPCPLDRRCAHRPVTGGI